MSREIKFRVWDNHYSRWEERPCTINKKGNLFIYNVDSGNWFEPQHTAYEVSWFTGLKDKNSKEMVYKDDIINFFDLRQYIVAWNDRTGQWVGSLIGNKNIQKPLWEILKIYRTVAKGHIGEGLHYKYPEISGNIHTTPELLEKQC